MTIKASELLFGSAVGEKSSVTVSGVDSGGRTAMTELFAGLNRAQLEAVLHDEGPMLVLAGAGSGKTRVLTTRIARLISEHRAEPHEILAVTFTNKAAGEMRERIERLLGYEPKGMWCGTFHSLGARMLRGAAPIVGRERNFTIYDEDDAVGAVKRVMELRGISTKEWAPKAVLRAISDAKNALVSPSAYAESASDTFTQLVSGVYLDLDLMLERVNAVTFDDLLTLPVRALEQDEGLRRHYQRRFRYILVDEYQDTNAAQYGFIAILGAETRNVMTVGDDDQSIYGWRGADIRNILDFERGFPGARVVRLEENYRSTPEILAVANQVIQENTERRGKTLRATRGPGEPVTIIDALDDRDEADVIADTIADGTDRKGWELRGCAVLYRTNAQSRTLEESFRRRGMSYRLIGAVRFYDRREIRDLMAWLKLIANPADDEAFLRAVTVPRRGIGDGALAQLSAYANANAIPLLQAASESNNIQDLRTAARESLSAFAELVARLREKATDASVDGLLRDVIESVRFMDMLKAEGQEGLERIENVREMVAGASETVADEGGEVGLRPLDIFLQNASLITGVDKLDPDADAVTMMTMHNAKGLEFPVVFVSGLEDGLFPLARATEDPTQLEEERRLFYVGVTRAERVLYLTSASQRRRYGTLMVSPPSRFLGSIPSELVRRSESKRSMLEGSGRRWGQGRGRAQFDGDGDGDVESNAGGGYGSGYRSGGYGSKGYGSKGYGGGSYGGGGYGSDPRKRSADEFGSYKVPGWSSRSAPREYQPEEESQDTPSFVAGERVQHHRFGTGTIAEVVGAGQEAKVRVDFDDEEIGRKTLIIVQAKLERAVE